MPCVLVQCVWGIFQEWPPKACILLVILSLFLERWVCICKTLFQLFSAGTVDPILQTAHFLLRASLLGVTIKYHIILGFNWLHRSWLHRLKGHLESHANLINSLHQQSYKAQALSKFCVPFVDSDLEALSQKAPGGLRSTFTAKLCSVLAAFPEYWVLIWCL